MRRQAKLVGMIETLKFMTVAVQAGSPWLETTATGPHGKRHVPRGDRRRDLLPLPAPTSATRELLGTFLPSVGCKLLDDLLLCSIRSLNYMYLGKAALLEGRRCTEAQQHAVNNLIIR